MENIHTKLRKQMKRKLDFQDIQKRFESNPQAINIGFLTEMFDILRIMEEKPVKERQTSLCNYVIIRSVSAIESFFKHYARELIDKKDIPTSEIFPKDEKIPLTKLDDLKDEKITKGKIIAYITNFQELDTINSLMSTIIPDIDFFKEVRKQSITFTYAGWNENVIFNLKSVYKIFELRHEIIHEMSDFEGTLVELRQYFANVMIFLNVSYVIIQKNTNKKK